MNSSSKMGEPKTDVKDEGLLTGAKENIAPEKDKKMETGKPEEKKEKKKEDKAAKIIDKKESDEGKNGEKQAKKKNKKEDLKEKEKQDKPTEKKKQTQEGKKNNEKKGGDDKKESLNATPSDAAKSNEGIDDKKGNKKTKKNKNKKNQLTAEGDEAKKESGDNKKTEKKDSAEKPQQKKKPEKKESKKDGVGGGATESEILSRLAKLENENKKLKSLADEVKKVTNSVTQLVSRVAALEKGVKSSGCGDAAKSSQQTKNEEKSKKKEPKGGDDDDVDLFGSDEEEDAEALKVKAERLKMYEEKKSKKPVVVAKSNIILDVKPWDDETDMKAMETFVRTIACDGLLWGASKLVPLAYGIHKLQISCVIEDDKVSVDWLQEQIEAKEDLVQSVDIAAFNKV